MKTIIVTIALLLASTPVCAQSCDALINEYIAWIESSTPAAPHRVQYTLVTNQSNDVTSSENVVGFSVGELRGSVCSSPVSGPACAYRAVLTGTGTQLFSDRVFFDNRAGANLVGRFDSRRADRLGVTVWPSGWVVLTLHSWGGAEVRFQGQCQDRALTGRIPGAGNRGIAIVTITFAKWDRSF